MWEIFPVRSRAGIAWAGQLHGLPKSAGRGVFSGRYESKVLAPEYVPHAVRRAHLRPVLARLCRQAIDYPFSSARAYVGRPARVPVDRSLVNAALERRNLFGLRGYREFMELPETPFVANLFERGYAFDSRIVGTKLFAMTARQLAAHPVAGPTREQLIEGVARLIRKTPEELFSKTHAGVLGRSLVAWYGVRAGSASLNEIGKWFSVSGATLGQGIQHYQQVAPELFALPVLPGLPFQAGTGLAGNDGEVI